MESYVGLYEVTPDFTFLIIKKEDKLLLQAPVQELLQMFADTETKFFLKVNDAQFEFVKVDEDNYATNIYSSSRKFLGQSSENFSVEFLQNTIITVGLP